MLLLYIRLFFSDKYGYDCCVCGMYLISYSAFGIYAAYMLLFHGFSNRKSGGTRTHMANIWHGWYYRLWKKKIYCKQSKFQYFLSCSNYAVVHIFHMRFAMNWRNQYDKPWFLYPFSCVHCVELICFICCTLNQRSHKIVQFQFVRGRNCAHGNFFPKQHAFQLHCTLQCVNGVPHGLHRVHNASDRVNDVYYYTKLGRSHQPYGTFKL